MSDGACVVLCVLSLFADEIGRCPGSVSEPTVMSAKSVGWTDVSA